LALRDRSPMRVVEDEVPLSVARSVEVPVTGQMPLMRDKSGHQKGRTR
jgi:hypothetical protein